MGLPLRRPRNPPPLLPFCHALGKIASMRSQPNVATKRQDSMRLRFARARAWVRVRRHGEALTTPPRMEAGYPLPAMCPICVEPCS